MGKIVQVFPDSSQVLPINDQFSGVGAALKDSRLQGILKGAANGATTLQYIMSDEKVVPGEEVITSGGDRIFPKGLPVGRVVSVEPGKDLFLNIRVVPSSRLDQLEEVLVVTKITEKMPDTKDLGPLRASDILAERLPTVPTKTDVDAAGNAKPGTATPGPPGAAPAGSATSPGAHPATGSVSKPVTGSAAMTANKPAGTTTPRTAAPGTTPGTAGAVKTKPANVGGARPAGTIARPSNEAAPATTTPSPSDAGSQAPANGDVSTPASEATQDGTGPEHEFRAPRHSSGRSAAPAMSTRVMPFRGSLTSREQVSVYEFSWVAIIFIPLVAVLIQIFIPVKVRFLPIIDLPFMVTIFFATARRNPISGCITGCLIGLTQDLFAGPMHPLGMYGIALTVIGYLASSLGLKIDVENPGSRFLITYIFFVIHQGVYYGVAHGLLRQGLQWSWSHTAISALANAVIGIFVFKFLDRFKQR